MASRRDVQGLIKALDDEEGFVRGVAIIRLTELEGENALNYIKRIWNSDSDSFARWAAVEAFGLLADKIDVQGYLIQALEDEDEGVRLNAIQILGRKGDTLALPFLNKIMLTEQNPDYRNEALRAIRMIDKRDFEEENREI